MATGRDLQQSILMAMARLQGIDDAVLDRPLVKELLYLLDVDAWDAVHHIEKNTLGD